MTAFDSVVMEAYVADGYCPALEGFGEAIRKKWDALVKMCKDLIRKIKEKITTFLKKYSKSFRVAHANAAAQKALKESMKKAKSRSFQMSDDPAPIFNRADNDFVRACLNRETPDEQVTYNMILEAEGNIEARFQDALTGMNLTALNQKASADELDKKIKELEEVTKDLKYMAKIIDAVFTKAPNENFYSPRPFDKETA